MSTRRNTLATILFAAASMASAPLFANDASTDDARAAALRANPRLTALSERASADRALELQMGLLPNPELGVELENLGGSGDRQAFEETETTVWVSQLVPVGG